MTISELRAALWARGYRPVAVVTRQKRPAGLDWTSRARRNPPDAAVSHPMTGAASTGILCDGLRALDIDIDDPAIADKIEHLASSMLGTGPVRGRDGTGKRLIVYRASEGAPPKRKIKGTSGALEILGHGQQFVAYGTHPDGMDYLWRDNIDLRVFGLENLVALTEDEITAFLDAAAPLIGAQSESERETERSSPPQKNANTVRPIRENRERLERYASTTLARIVDDLASMRSGGRNDALNSGAMRCGAMAARGWISENECRNALIGACQSNGLLKEDGHASCLATFRSGWNAGLSKPAKDPDDRYGEADDWNGTIGLKPRDAHGEILAGQNDDLEDEEEQEFEPETVPLDEKLTHVGGLLGRVTDWICDSGPTGNRVLALSAALPFLATIFGRMVATPTGGGGDLSLYVISTYPTGDGKGHQKKALLSLFSACDLMRHCGGEFTSGAAIDIHVTESPLSLAIIDEYADMLGDITASGAKPYSKQIGQKLKELWGLGFSPYQTAKGAQRGSLTVHAPQMSIYGMTTNDQLMRVIKGREIASGLVNRHIFFDGGKKTKQHPKIDARKPPRALIEELLRAYRLGFAGTGNMSSAFDKNRAENPEPFIIPWADQAARQAYDDFSDECDRRKDDDPDLGALYSRTAFIAVKFATILACGENLDRPKVTAAHMNWAAKLAMHATDNFYISVKKHMVDPLETAKIYDKILDKLRDAKPLRNGMMNTVKFSEMFTYMYKHLSRPGDFENHLKSLAAAQKIVFSEVPSRGCLGKTRYITLATSTKPKKIMAA